MGPMQSKVPVTDADKAKSYFKYYERETAKLDPAKLATVYGAPMSSKGKLTFGERTKILEPGFDDEKGFCVLADGTGYVSDSIFIPGATAEMIDWFIGWRGLDPLRFVIEDPNQNISAVSMQTNYYFDEDRTAQEKYWDTTQVIQRKAGMGVKKSFLNFKCPLDAGFRGCKFGAEEETKTLICARNYDEGYAPAARPDYFICHQVIEKDGGAEVRTRIWYGWTVKYGKDFKQLEDGFFMEPFVPQALMLENANEWANIAAILPALYAEEKDN